MKSSVDFYVDVLSRAVCDVASFLRVTRSVKPDLDYIKARVQSEGVSFLTKTLPALGKMLDQALCRKGLFDPVGYRKVPGTTSPQFLGWLWIRIVDNRGSASNPDPMDVRHARQLTYMFYKLELPYEDEQKETVIDSFRATDSLCANGISRSANTAVLDYATKIISRITCSARKEFIIPKHGPGAVATGESQDEKMRFKRIYSDLHGEFPFDEWNHASLGHLCDEYRRMDKIEHLEYGTAKVVLVPKDSRGPRLISAEPLEFQWIQQGIARQLVRLLESHPYTRGQVNFTSQYVNRMLASLGSAGASWVTLDMKDASDRVSLALIRRLFSGTHILPWLEASRTKATMLPNGETIVLNKFAPMGSALCFPVESLVFWALSVACLVCVRGLSRYSAMRSVYVYGDDLIVGREDYPDLLQLLPEYGLMFNQAKCCTDGLFRESCGLDAFAGVDVTPLKLRTVWASHTRAFGNLLSWVEYSNVFHQRRMFLTAEVIEQAILSQGWVLPTLDHRDGPAEFLCFRRYGASFHGHNLRFNRKLQRREIYAVVPETPTRKSRASEWQKIFWYLTREPTEGHPTDREISARSLLPVGPDESGLCHPLAVHSHPVRRRVTPKRRWCALYA